MLQEILKQATDLQHQNLEQMMFVDKIMNGTLSQDQYKKILLTNYIVHSCLELQLFDNLNEDLKAELNLNQRKKLPALLEDLSEAGIEKPEPDCNQNSFAFDNDTAAILGALYVLEGATLGGNVIVKKLKVNSSLQDLNLGFHYYQVYGQNLIPNWKQFCYILNTKVPEKEYDKSIKSALAVFDYFFLTQQENRKTSSVFQ